VRPPSLPFVLATLPLPLLLLFSGTASANAAAPLELSPSGNGGVFVAQPTALAVEHEDLTFRCDSGGCDFQAVYHVVNPTDARVDVLGAFFGLNAEGVSATADGGDARRTLTPDQDSAIANAVAPYDASLARTDASIAHVGFELAVDPHARATLVFAGHMRSVPRLDDEDLVTRELAFPPLEVRHLWLGTTARHAGVEEFAYALSPIRAWAGSATIDVAVHATSGRPWNEGQDGWTVTDEGGERVARRSVATRDAATLRFTLVRPATGILHGGPLIGVGARLDAPEARGRLGYEVAYPWWLIYSASVETSFKGRTTVVPVVEAATPNGAYVIPSVGLGAGVPVQFVSGQGARAGLRMQLTLSFPLVSVVFPVDVFPGAASDVWQAALFGQLSF
jgi:hypothetical protein